MSGITWDVSKRADRGSRRRGTTLGLALVAMAGLAAPALADGTPAPLPSLTAVEQVIGAPAAWSAGARGQGVDVAVLDTGVAPVAGLDGPNKVIYGPDLSFDSQDPAKAYVDGYGHGTVMASLIAGNDRTPDGFQGVA